MPDIFDNYPEIIRSSSEPVVVLEIGCGRAEDTERMVDWIIHQRKKHLFYVFEPEMKNIPFIEEKVGSKVVVLSVAIGDKDGTVDFISSGTWPLSGSVKEPKNHMVSYPWIPWQPPTPVQMMKLDTFIQLHALKKIDFIWADTQGAEDLLIAGGQEALRRTRYFYTEYYSTEEYAGQIGIEEIQKRLPGNWLLQRSWVGDIPGSGNALFMNLDFK